MIKTIFLCNDQYQIAEVLSKSSDYESIVKNEVLVSSIFGDEIIKIINQSKIHNDIEQQKIGDLLYAIAYPFNNVVLISVIQVCEKEDIHEFVKFMSSIRAANTRYLNQNYNTIIFEEIQKLNNELVNKNREIAKMTHKLRTMNEILSSRLIKDPLTDLVSRYQYADEIEAAIEKYPDNAAFFVFIDIDNFKSVNDTYGHLVGDQYLKEFAQRIKKLPLVNAVRLRISGDEFGLFVYGVDHVDSLYFDLFWRMFRDNVIYPIVINNIEMKLEVSLGIAVYSKDSLHINEMIDFADFAMYQAKHSGKNKYCLFDKEEYQKRKEK